MKTENPKKATVAVRNAARLLAWLQADGGTTGELLDWCYYGFGTGRDSAQPNVQLAAAIPDGGDRYPLSKRFAERIAAYLRLHPTLEMPRSGTSAEKEHTLYNLLALAAAINCPDVLAAPLFSSYLELVKISRVLPDKVRTAFTDALINNQTYRPELRECWFEMAGSRKNPVLQGGFERGFEGLVMMPGEIAGQYDRESLGRGHLLLAKGFAANTQTRRQLFREQALAVMQMWDITPETLIKIADEYRWVEEGCGWAVAALCDYFTVDFGEVGQHGQEFWLVWHWFARCFEAWGGVTITGQLCGGHVLQVEITENAAKQCKVVQQLIKQYAPSRPDISEREAMGRIETILDRVRAYATKNQDTSNTPQAKQKITTVLSEFHGQARACC